jgi:hypothetical protein
MRTTFKQKKTLGWANTENYPHNSQDARRKPKCRAVR